MRAKLRAVTVVFGGAALVILALLIATAVTRSLILAVVTAVVGVLAVVGAVLVANAVSERLLRRGDQASTRVSNLDQRVRGLDQRVRGLDDSRTSDRRRKRSSQSSTTAPRASWPGSGLAPGTPGR